MKKAFIFDNKKYDVETSEKVLEYKESYPVRILGKIVHQDLDKTLYKTKKGAWFTVVIFQDKSRFVIEDEDSVRKLFIGVNNVELYEKYFGELEEA